MLNLHRAFGRGLLALALAAGGMFPASVLAQPTEAPAAVATADRPAEIAGTRAMQARDWSRQLWDAAREGKIETFYALLDKLPADAGDPHAAAVHRSALKLKASLDARETERIKRQGEVRTELDKVVAELASVSDQPKRDITLSKALISVVELHMLAVDKPAVLNEPAISALIADAQRSAEAAEARGDWLSASELYYRLAALFDETGRFKHDTERLAQRLAMLRLYVPEQLWRLRNERQVAAGLEKLPPYNPAGDDFHDKLTPLTETMVVSAIKRAGDKHVEQVPLRDILLHGINGLRTMATTGDLRQAFPKLGDDAAREKFLAALDREQERISSAQVDPDLSDIDHLLSRTLAASRESVQINDQSVIHEFGNGAMTALDPFSAIIWPDEVARFNRTTQGRLIGIGVEIQYDEVSNIRVVTPLEGGPAMKAGVRAGDIIKKIDGKSAFGITLDQAVELITGPRGTPVTITIDRKDASKPADAAPEEIEFALERREVELKSVKGWKRGQRDDQWSWFIDPVNKIGYVRVTGFSERTTADLDKAVRAMKGGDVQGLILDLRFNPGGLLDEAVKIVNRFIDRGLIVSTQVPGNRIERQEKATRGQASLAKLPVVVLINEGSASASEIVSGAIQDYARRDVIKALIVGNRSFGKGSVQDVTMLGGGTAAMKLTTQYYLLPDGRLIHRKENAREWGVPADLAVEMLPGQITDSLILRRNADLPPEAQAFASAPEPKQDGKPDSAAPGSGKPASISTMPPNPDDLIDKGLDLQLHAALVLLQSQTLGAAQANRE